MGPQKRECARSRAGHVTLTLQAQLVTSSEPQADYFLSTPSPCSALHKPLSFYFPKPKEYWHELFPQLNLVSFSSIQQIFTE